MFRALMTSLSVVVLLLLAEPLSAAVAQPAPDTDAAARAKLNSTARLIAGLPPTHPAHQAFTQTFAHTAAWKEHSEFMRAAWGGLNDRQVAPMIAWRTAELPSRCPAGNTLMYPFSGPDFFNG